MVSESNPFSPSEIDVYSHYIGTKISKVRWANEQAFRHESLTFCVASWGAGSQGNSVKLYQCNSSRNFDTTEIPDWNVHLVHSTPHQGDVTDLVFLDASHIFTSSSNGYVNIYSINHEPGNSKKSLILKKSRRHHGNITSNMECTAISLQPNTSQPDLVSVGLDGNIVTTKFERDELTVIGKILSNN